MSKNEVFLRTKVIEKDGKDIEVKENKNGTWSDVATGRITIGTDKQGSFEGGVITKADAPLMQARKGEAAQSRARDAMLQAVQDKQLPADQSEDGWYFLMLELATFALNGQRGKHGKDWTGTRLEAIRLLGKATHFLADKKEIDIREVSMSVKVSEGDILASLFEKRYPGDPQKALEELSKYRVSLSDNTEWRSE